MKTPNHMWRMAYIDYEGSQAQCLTCKAFFASDANQVYQYCPCCGIELKKEFTKKNKRWGWFTFKRHFPVIECWCLVDRYVELDKNWFSIKPKQKLEQVWEKHGSVLMSFNGFCFRKNLLRNIESNSKVVDSPSKMKFVFKTWDGKEKTIYGSKFTAVTNRKYQKIDLPKPHTLRCSGLISSYYNQSKLMNNVFMTEIKESSK